MTDTIVPDTTPEEVVPQASLRMFVGAVVRLKVGRLHHQAGTKALIAATREEGRYHFELLVPGFPIKFWVTDGEVDILQAPDQDYWKLLLESPGD